VPIYDYVCRRCDHRTEVVHGIHGHGPTTCPSCGAEGTMGKAIVPPAIHFKGSGWAKKDRSATSTPGSSRRSKTDDAASPGVPGGDGGSPSPEPSAAPTSDGSTSASTTTTSSATGKE